MAKRNKELKLYIVAFYEDVGIKSALLHRDGEQGAFIDTEMENLPYIQFFKSKEEAQKICDEWNNDDDFDEEAVVEEITLNIK